MLPRGVRIKITELNMAYKSNMANSCLTSLFSPCVSAGMKFCSLSFGAIQPSSTGLLDILPLHLQSPTPAPPAFTLFQRIPFHRSYLSPRISMPERASQTISLSQITLTNAQKKKIWGEYKRVGKEWSSPWFIDGGSLQGWAWYLRQSLTFAGLSSVSGHWYPPSCRKEGCILWSKRTVYLPFHLRHTRFSFFCITSVIIDRVISKVHFNHSLKFS